MSSAARLRQALLFPRACQPKGFESASHRGAIGAFEAAVLASQRLETSIQSYTVVRETTKPSRRARNSSLSRSKILSKYANHRVLIYFEACFQKGKACFQKGKSDQNEGKRPFPRARKRKGVYTRSGTRAKPERKKNIA